MEEDNIMVLAIMFGLMAFVVILVLIFVMTGNHNSSEENASIELKIEAVNSSNGTNIIPNLTIVKPQDTMYGNQPEDLLDTSFLD